MDILKWFLGNWDDILVGILLVVLASLLIYQWMKRFGSVFRGMPIEEKIAYIKRLLENLSPIALNLVTEAEIAFGGGTGKLKRSYVIDELYSRIPDEYKKYVTEGNLDAVLTDALNEARLLWEHNDEVKKLMKGESAL